MINRLKDNWGTAVVVVVLLTGFVFAYACPASATEVTRLRLATHSGSVGLHADTLKFFAEEVKKRTKGRVEIEIVWGEALAKMTEMCEAVRLGTADLGEVATVYHSPQLPYLASTQVVRFRTEVPFTKELGLKALSVYRKLAEEFTEVADECKKQNQVLLGVMTHSPEALVSRKPVRALADLKGWKIRTWGFTGPQIVKDGLGAAPVSMPSVETYDGLNKGVLDASFCTVEMHYRYKYYEVCKFWNSSFEKVFKAMPLTFILTVNLNKWEKLSREDQKTMLEVGEATTQRFSEEFYRLSSEYFKELTQKLGMVVTQLPDSEMKTLMTMTSPVLESYIKRIEASGARRAREIVERHIDLWKK